MSKSRDDTIFELTRRGFLQTEIAEVIGINVNTVRLRQQILGLKPTNDGPEFTEAVLELRKAGVSQSATARRLGKSEQVVRLHEEILEQQGRWTRYRNKHEEEVIDEVLRRSLDGEGPRKIAADMGMKPHSIWKIRTRLREEGFRIDSQKRKTPKLSPIDWSKYPRFEDVTFKVR